MTTEAHDAPGFEHLRRAAIGTDAQALARSDVIDRLVVADRTVAELAARLYVAERERDLLRQLYGQLEGQSGVDERERSSS